jgi:hypothetical protein
MFIILWNCGINQPPHELKQWEMAKREEEEDLKRKKNRNLLQIIM